MQLTKKHDTTIILWHSESAKNDENIFFKYAISKKTCHHNYFYDIINPQK